MVFSGKIYDQVKENLDTYLFGFDKSQLDVSLLKGAIKLDGVNIKPNKAEKLMKSLALPFSLKAGTVGVLEIKLNLMSRMFSKDASSMQISLDNAFFIIGPSMRVLSKDESYLQETEQEMLYPYDEHNAFNIFTNNLKLRKKPSIAVQVNDNPPDSKSGSSSKQSMTSEQKDLIKGLTLVIKRLHLRYEDDYFSQENPYSCGLVIDELRLEASETRIFFERLADLHTQSQNLSSSGQNVQNQLCKDFNLTGLRFYWNCMSEMYIPTSLWESTRHMKYQIFEAMDAQQLNELMIQAFTESGQNQYQFINQAPVTIRSQLHCFEQSEQQQTLGNSPHSVNRMTMQITSPVDLHLNPFILNDMQHFLDRMQNSWLLKDLKQYRPHRRPLTDVPTHLEGKTALRRKRKLIVRDWFFFVVWYIRLRRIITEFYKLDEKNAYLLFDSRYSYLLHQALNKECTFEDLLQKIQSMAVKDENSSAADQQQSEGSKAFRNEFDLRMQSFAMTLFTGQLFDAKTNPKLSMESAKLALNLSASGVPSGADRCKEEKFSLSAQMGSLEISTFNTQKPIPYQVKPRQLSQMFLKQDVLVQNNPANGGSGYSAALSTIQSNASSRAHPYSSSSQTNQKNAANNARLRNEYYNSRGQQHQQQLSSHKSLHPSQDHQQAAMLGQAGHQSNSNYMANNQWNDDDEDRHMPNITSPGRATMIGPKVNSDQMPTIQGKVSGFSANTAKIPNRQQNSQNQNNQKQQQIQANESKDSLVQSMLQSMSRFLGGGKPEVQQTTTIPVVNIRKDSEDYGGMDLSAPPSYNSITSSYHNSVHNNSQLPHAKQALVRQTKEVTPVAKGSRMQDGLKARNAAISSSQMNIAGRGGGALAGRPQGGLDQLLRKRALQRSGGTLSNNNSFYRRANMQTDSTAGQPAQMAVDNSGILGSEMSQADQYEDDFVMSVPNFQNNAAVSRKINHMPKQSYPNMASKQQVQIQDGIRNKNFISSAAGLYSPSRGSGSHQGLAAQQASSALGKLLGPNKAPAGQAPRATSQIDPQQQAMGSQNQIVMADTTNNVLPTSRLQIGSKGTYTVQKERLVRICAQTGASQDQQSAHCSRIDYKLVHERGFAKELSGELAFGRVEVSYSHNALISLSEFLVGIKDLPMFRDLNLVPACMLPKQKKQITPETVAEAKEKELTKSRVKATLSSLVETRNKASLSKDHKKLKQVGSMIQQCIVDVKVRGERVYVSLFDDLNRNQIAKFVSPPVSLAMLAHHPRQNPGEASYEVLGFQAQQSTDLNLLGNFIGVLTSQLQLFATNESIRRGQICYNEIIEERKKKEDERRFITQQIMRKQRRDLSGQMDAAMLNDFTSAKQATESTQGRGFALPTKPSKNPSAAPKFNSKVRKPHVSRSGQAAKPGFKKHSELSKQLSAKAGSSSALFNGLKKEFGEKSMKARAASKAQLHLPKSLVPVCSGGLGSSDDYDDVPDPKDCQDGDDSSDDALLRDKHETDLSDDDPVVKKPLGRPMQKMETHPQIQDMQQRFKERKKSQSYQHLDTVRQVDDRDSVSDNNRMEMDIQDLKSPNKDFVSTERASFSIEPGAHIRQELSNMAGGSRKLLHADSDDDNPRMNLAYSGIGNPKGNPAHQVAAIQFDQPLKSNTNTDSAGGEAFDKDEEDVYKLLHSQPAKLVPCDQDEPLLHTGHESYFRSGHHSSSAENNNASGERPLTKKQRARSGSGSDTNLWPAVNLPMQPRVSEETKKWKNTKDSINMQKMMRKVSGGTGTQNSSRQRQNPQQLARKESGSFTKGGSQGNSKLNSNRLFNQGQQQNSSAREPPIGASHEDSEPEQHQIVRSGKRPAKSSRRSRQ